jgi:hypothetical protein
MPGDPPTPDYQEPTGHHGLTRCRRRSIRMTHPAMAVSVSRHMLLTVQAIQPAAAGSQREMLWALRCDIWLRLSA